MDKIANPYAPGAGTPPPELAGREEVLEIAQNSILRKKAGRPSQHIILWGLRGVGKTVLLNKIQSSSEEIGALNIFIEIEEGKNIKSLISYSLRKVIIEVSKIEKAKDLSKKALSTLKSFISTFKISYEGFDITIDPEVGSADTGSINNDLSELICSVGEAVKKADKVLVISIDEIQYIPKEEFSAIISSMHMISQKNLPVIFIGAGLPQILSLSGDSRTYAERLFEFIEIGSLSKQAAKDAVLNPALRQGVTITEDAIEEILSITERYPYFLQQWSYDSWNIAEKNEINIKDVIQANSLSLSKLDRSFFKVRFDRCTFAEKKYMRGLAELGKGVHQSSSVAETLKVESSKLAPIKARLIKKGMIYSPNHGGTAFTVPLFDGFMKRTMKFSVWDDKQTDE